jgi:ABC-type Zn uptake system ZnuABC Zn-binding protein ZnuA
MHIKVNIKNAQNALNNIKTSLGEKWPAFIAQVKEQARAEVQA